MPGFITDTDSDNGVAVFDMSPDFLDAGSYDMDVSVFDGSVGDTVTVTVDVLEAGNQLPVLDTILPQTGNELVLLEFDISVTDIDGTEPPLLTGTGLPTGATVTDNRNGTGRFSWTPGDTQAGDYTITIQAEDFDVPGVFHTMDVPISVADTNRIPFLFTSGGRTIDEGDTLYYTVAATDPDGTTPVLSAFTDGDVGLTTPNMNFTDSGNGVGLLTFVPDHTQGGSNFLFYFVKFIVVDGVDPTLTDTSATVSITVNDRNFPPTIEFVDAGPYTVSEGDSIVIRVVATDIDGTASPLLGADPLPPNSTFETVNDTGYFRFYPDFTQAPTVYTVDFGAVDQLFAVTIESIDVQVVEAGNQAV